VELTEKRSYEKVIDRLYNAIKHHRDMSFVSMGSVTCPSDTYPLFCVTIGNRFDSNLKDVLISAGVHGEEPAGVFALLKFLEEDVSEFMDEFRFLIFPCINPFGFEYNNRFNSQPDPNHEGKYMNINREFKKGTLCAEVKVVMTQLEMRSRQFVCTIDLHETDPNYFDEESTCDDNPKEFYMWESCLDKNLRIGDRVIKSIESVIPVCRWDEIYKDISSDGVIWYPEGCKNETFAERTTFEVFLADNYTPQAFTLETPCGWHINQRVFAHQLALRSILELKRSIA